VRCRKLGIAGQGILRLEVNIAKGLKEAAALTDWGPFSLRGRSALITGAAMGIGNGIAKRFVEAGAKVMAADISLTIESVARDLDAAHARGIVFDVSDPAAAAAAVQKVVDAFGSIDILVNNAGIYPISPFLDMTPEFFDRVISINMRGLVFLCKAAAAQMVKQGKGGKIVNVASIDAMIPSTPGLTAYDTSKGGVVMFTKALALEMAPHNITVNARRDHHRGCGQADAGDGPGADRSDVERVHEADPDRPARSP
jgi:NAD(P)-dependent dehydrogenase (short-subunit alcohol dehydrogenase family)